MLASWRPIPLTAFALAVVLPGSAALALDQPELQEMEGLLRELGFDPGPVDGVVDDITLEAIRQYHDFALRPGPPEPSQSLLDELRGVAAAFAALNADKHKEAAAEAPAPAVSQPAPEPEPVVPPAPEPRVPEPPAQAAELPEKVVVPPPPAPPKLTSPEAKKEPPDQLAQLPPAEAPGAEAPAPPSAAEIAESQPLDPAALLQQRIDEELAPYRTRLKDGSLSRSDLARQFNIEGRKLLQQAQYEEAILKFSVAIHLDPSFAGAYSNRGTAYQIQEEADLAQQDFDKAKTLGFGGVRPKDQQLPLN